MNKLRKKLLPVLVSLSILICMFSISVGAIQVATVKTYWEEVLQTSNNSSTPPVTYTQNVSYMDLRFVNGYNYTTTSKDITSFISAILGKYTTAYTRTYTTY